MVYVKVIEMYVTVLMLYVTMIVVYVTVLVLYVMTYPPFVAESKKKAKQACSLLISQAMDTSQLEPSAIPATPSTLSTPSISTISVNVSFKPLSVSSTNEF